MLRNCRHTLYASITALLLAPYAHAQDHEILNHDNTAQLTVLPMAYQDHDGVIGTLYPSGELFAALCPPQTFWDYVCKVSLQDYTVLDIRSGGGVVYVEALVNESILDLRGQIAERDEKIEELRETISALRHSLAIAQDNQQNNPNPNPNPPDNPPETPEEPRPEDKPPPPSRDCRVIGGSINNPGNTPISRELHIDGDETMDILIYRNSEYLTTARSGDRLTVDVPPGFNHYTCQYA